jgi:TRAP-type C4-dicarboxylate transport system permease small subunit
MLSGESASAVPAVCGVQPTAPGCPQATTGAQDNLNNRIKAGISTAIGLAGLVAAAFIIYGGIQYSTSSGDASKVSKAKNTIMYAVIGLIVSALAFAIVNFVIGSL